ncbi:hypothetical protein SAMN05192575_101982 [Nocardioides alpinus]|uniref:Uncharacterized protein n=1 Tax=Nocardioides alpinus TaxID=748909 RepID=A0A1I0WFZ2_9ACTN|nr:hypothetical protein [Nocardioides alpinus]SFA87652.1 hypothetical protein SAMN05192575_101982 [Nocardioides alpinus]
MRRAFLALLAVGLTVGGLSAVQPRATADMSPDVSSTHGSAPSGR